MGNITFRKIFSSVLCPKSQGMRPFSLSVCRTGAAVKARSQETGRCLFCWGGSDRGEDGGQWFPQRTHRGDGLVAVVLDNLLGHLRQNTFGQRRRGSLQKRQSTAGGVKTIVKDCFIPRYTTFSSGAFKCFSWSGVCGCSSKLFLCFRQVKRDMSVSDIILNYSAHDTKKKSLHPWSQERHENE